MQFLVHFIFSFSFKNVVFVRDRGLRFEGVEDSRFHDVIPAGELLKALFLDFSIIFSFHIILHKGTFTHVFRFL